MKIPRFLAGIIGGTTLGLLFAQKKGKDLRKSLLQDKDKVLENLGKEFLSVGKEIADEVKKIAESKDAQEMINMAKTKFKGLAEIAKGEGGEFAQSVEKYLSEIAKYAKQKADEVKKTLNVKTGAAKPANRTKAKKKPAARKRSSKSKV